MRTVVQRIAVAAMRRGSHCHKFMSVHNPADRW